MDAKATAAGLVCFDAQNTGTKVSRRTLLIPWSCGSYVLIPKIRGSKKKAKATAAGSECFDPQYWEIKVSRRPFLVPWSCGSNASILTIRGSKWREGHIFGTRLFCDPALGDQNDGMYKTRGWGWLLIPDHVELIWKPISLICEFIPDSWKVPRRPIFIPWYCGSHGLIPTRRPHFRDQIVLCPSIGESKLRDV